MCIDEFGSFHTIFCWFLDMGWTRTLQMWDTTQVHVLVGMHAYRLHREYNFKINPTDFFLSHIYGQLLSISNCHFHHVSFHPSFQYILFQKMEITMNVNNFFIFHFLLITGRFEPGNVFKVCLKYLEAKTF